MIPPPSVSVDVLHLEDDDQYAELVRLWVSARGLTLRRVRSRTELLRDLETSAPPRCLLLDLAVGDSRGLDLCSELKRDPALQQLPIVLLSGASVTACECHERGALHFLRKGEHGEAELMAALKAVISQHARSSGVVDYGDLQLDPRDRSVRRAGRTIATLASGPFKALMLLVKSAPRPVTDEDLYLAFLERRSYSHKEGEDDFTIRDVVRNYISRLRKNLGEAVGPRIARRRNDGYAYLPPAGSKDQFQID